MLYKGVEIKVAAAILIHIAAIARTTRIITSWHLEGVIVPFHVAMLPAVDIIYLAIR